MSLPPMYPPLYKTTEIHLPRKIVIGLNYIEKLAREVVYVGGGAKVLILTDRAVRAAGAPDKAASLLKNEGLECSVYDDIESEPRIEMVEEASSFAKAGRFDVVVGVGGGSVMDAAKLASASVSNPGNLREYIGLNLLRRRGLPLICIPTTSGTGSEVTQYAVVNVDGRKKTCVSPFIIPDVALVDPTVTLSMPQNVTAGSGMDALAHAIESLISTEATPVTDSLAYVAIRLIFRYLRRACYKPNDIDARYNMSFAATVAGISLCNAKMVVGHSISQTFGPEFNVPHGISNAITLPYVIKFYTPASSEKLAQVAIEADQSVEGLSSREASLAAARAVKNLAADIGIPGSLRSVGVTEEVLPKIAEEVLANFPRPNSPIELNKNNVLEILKWMYFGAL
ncbi:MAG: iron-containing alcohol dehydrogenase [Nitrososphaeria archaeon]